MKVSGHWLHLHLTLLLALPADCWVKLTTVPLPPHPAAPLGSASWSGWSGPSGLSEPNGLSGPSERSGPSVLTGWMRDAPVPGVGGGGLPGALLAPLAHHCCCCLLARSAWEPLLPGSGLHPAFHSPVLCWLVVPLVWKKPRQVSLSRWGLPLGGADGSVVVVVQLPYSCRERVRRDGAETVGN